MPPTPPDPAPAPARRGYLVPGTIALVAMAAIAVVVNLTVLDHHRPAALDGTDVATRVSQAIQAEHSSSTPPRLSCPTSEPLRAGLQFTCVLEGDAGSRRTVEITETDGSGTYRWAIGPVIR